MNNKGIIVLRRTHEKTNYLRAKEMMNVTRAITEGIKEGQQTGRERRQEKRPVNETNGREYVPLSSVCEMSHQYETTGYSLLRTIVISNTKR